MTVKWLIECDWCGWAMDTDYHEVTGVRLPQGWREVYESRGIKPEHMCSECVGVRVKERR